MVACVESTLMLTGKGYGAPHLRSPHNKKGYTFMVACVEGRLMFTGKGYGAPHLRSLQNKKGYTFMVACVEGRSIIAGKQETREPMYWYNSTRVDEGRKCGILLAIKMKASAEVGRGEEGPLYNPGSELLLGGRARIRAV